MNRKKGKSSQKRVAASSETTSSTSSSNNLDIPGFYYDEVKKRYFKIQPNYATQSSVVTNDIIKERKHNQKILKTRFKIENILLSVFKNELGATKELYQTFNDQIISRLDVKSKIEFDDLKGIQYMSVFDSEYESNFAYVCLSYLDYHQQPFDVRIIKVNKALSHLRTERVSFKAQDIYYDEKQSNSGAYVHDNRYLVTTRANFNQSFVQIVKLTQSSQYTNILIETQIADFNVKNTLWSSCLNSNEKLNYSLTKCALGFADCGQVRDIYDSRKRFHLNSLSSDVFSIKFHTIDTETLVYVGCRNKFIFGNDLRIDNKRNQSFTSKLKHESSVTSMVFPYENSNLLYSTDYSGLIYLWDLRFDNCIKKYHGNFNQNRSFELKLSSCGNYFYTVGQDGHTRIWNTKSSKPIKTIFRHEQYNYAYADTPHVHLFDNFNMLYGINKSLTLYSI